MVDREIQVIDGYKVIVAPSQVLRLNSQRRRSQAIRRRIVFCSLHNYTSSALGNEGLSLRASSSKNRRWAGDTMVAAIFTIAFSTGTFPRDLYAENVDSS